MIVKLVCKMNTDDTYEISLGDQRQNVCTSQEIDFEIEHSGVYQISIIRQPINIPKPVSLIMNLLTFPLQGIFHIITFNTDDHWENSIQAYNLEKCSCEMDIEKDTVLEIKINKSQYLPTSHCFSMPSISTYPELNFTTEICSDRKEVFNHYYGFVKKVLSMSVIFYALFIFLLYQSLRIRNIMASIVVSLTLIAISAALFIILLTAKRRRKKVLGFFDTQECSRKGSPNGSIDDNRIPGKGGT